MRIDRKEDIVNEFISESGQEAWQQLVRGMFLLRLILTVDVTLACEILPIQS